MILAICTFFKAFVYLNLPLNSELAKECTKMFEGKIMAQERWLQLKMAGWAKFWCLDYWKNGSRQFYLWPPGKIVPKVLITPKQRKISYDPWTGFSRDLSPAERQQGKTMKLTGCLCISALLEILLNLLHRVYIKLLPRMENFILMVLVSASVTMSSIFLKVIPRMI